MRVRSLLKQHITFSLALTGATCTRAHLAETTEEVASPDISVLDQPDQPARLFRTALPTACHSIRSQCFSTWISPRHPRSRANSLPKTEFNFKAQTPYSPENHRQSSFRSFSFLFLFRAGHGPVHAGYSVAEVCYFRQLLARRRGRRVLSRLVRRMLDRCRRFLFGWTWSWRIHAVR